MKVYFHPEKSIGYNFCRTHINSCDFSLENWACCEVEELLLTDFNVNRDKQSILPIIEWTKALLKENIILFSLPWGARMDSN